MYVKITIELVEGLLRVFCGKRGLEPKSKEVQRVFAAVANAGDVKKYFFCEAKCVSSKKRCLKEVEKEGMHCHLHDPKRKCKGSTKKGAKCGGVTKKGEEYCWRHLGEKKSKVMVNDDYPSDYDSDLQYEEEVAPPKKSQKKKSKVISSDEEEVAPPKKSQKKKSKVISSDEEEVISSKKSPIRRRVTVETEDEM
jgi:tRNA-binding EMAP/Myf-like protein